MLAPKQTCELCLSQTGPSVFLSLSSRTWATSKHNTVFGSEMLHLRDEPSHLWPTEQFQVYLQKTLWTELERSTLELFSKPIGLLWFMSGLLASALMQYRQAEDAFPSVLLMGSGSVQSISEGTLNPCQSVTLERGGGLKSAESFWLPVAICPWTNVMDHLQPGHLPGLIWGCEGAARMHHFPVSSEITVYHRYSQQHLRELHPLSLC